MLLKITADRLILTSKRYGISHYEPFPRTYVVNWDCKPHEIEFLMGYGTNDFQVTKVEPYQGNRLMKWLHSRKTITANYHEMFEHLRKKLW